MAEGRTAVRPGQRALVVGARPVAYCQLLARLHAQHAGDVMGVIPGDRNGITGGRAVYKKSGQGGPLLALGILKSF